MAEHCAGCCGREMDALKLPCPGLAAPEREVLLRLVCRHPGAMGPDEARMCIACGLVWDGRRMGPKDAAWAAAEALLAKGA